MLNKITTFICIFAALLLNAFAQAPQLISYQGVARDNSGNTLASQPISLSLSIHQTTPNGTVRWSATYDVTTNQFGLFSVEIGAGNLVSGSMNIDWSNGPYFLETAMDATGGSNYLSLGTQQLLSVPYALHSGSSADNQWTKTGDDIHNTNIRNVGINEVLPYTTLHVSRNVADASTPISLQENTGIFIVGPITDNIVADYRGIQARHGDYIGNVLNLTVADLDLQRLGGDILIHGDYNTDAGKIVVKSNGRFGIGVLQPQAPLHVSETGTVEAESMASYIINSASTTSTDADHARVGLGISTTGVWSGNPLSKNIGIYVSNVTGQTGREANIAAVLNGNTVIGDITASPTIIGSNGSNVLAIQNGTVPTSTVNSGIQIYSGDVSIPGSPPLSSVIHVMNGDGTVIQLYQQPALTPSDPSSVSGSAFGVTEANVINNMRDRIDALELRLKNLGLLEP